MFRQKNSEPNISPQSRLDEATSTMANRPTDSFVKVLALAKEGFTPAKNDVAGFYMNGIGCRKDEVQAVRWYEEAWREGDIMAGLNLAQLKMHGIGTKIDVNGALGICLDTFKTENEYHEGAEGLLKKIMMVLGEPPRDELNRYLSLFVKHIHSENFKLADNVITEAIDKYPAVWGLYKNRAIARSRIDDYAGAKSDLDIAIALNPQDSSLFEMRGMMRFNLRDPNADEDFRHSEKMKKEV